MNRQLIPLLEDKANVLMDAIEESRKRLKPFREFRTMAIREYVGPRYGLEASEVRKPVLDPMLSQLIRGYARHASARPPKWSVSTHKKGLRPQAALMREALNHVSQEIGLGETIKRAVVDAMITFGVVHVGLMDAGSFELDGEQMSAGQPFVETVSLDDLVFDVMAKTRDRMTFIGHRTSIPLEVAKNSDIFNKLSAEELAELQPTTYSPHTEYGEDRAQTVAIGNESFAEHFIDQIEFYTLWLPYHNSVVMMECKGHESGGAPMTGRVLAERPYVGPEWGPYIWLGYIDVPDAVIPEGPAQILYDLHMVINSESRKLARQADRQKDVLLVTPQGAGSDSDAVKNSSDGDIVPVAHPDAFKPASFGGANQNTFATYMSHKQGFNESAGNLNLLLGISPQSGTLGQDQLLAQNAGGMIEEMSSTTDMFITRIGRSLAWYLMNDPLIEIPMTMRVEGVRGGIEVVYTAEQIEGDYLDFNFSIVPDSTRPTNSAQRANAILQLFDRIIPNMMQMMAQQGIAINAEALFRMLSQNMDLPELMDILIMQTPDVTEQPVGQPTQGAPTFKRSVQERVTGGRITDRGAAHQQIMAAFGKSPGGASGARSVSIPGATA